MTTTTISKAQHEEALNRVVEAGLQDKIDLRLDDYRDLEGQYDKLVSIEMIEAVGHQFLDTYIEKCSHLLKPNGLMCIQAITIRDQQYEQAKHEVDFIKKHIFPGGFLPSVTAIGSSLTRVSDLQITHIEDIGLHYAQTLSDWRRRFMDNIETVKAQGYSAVFRRMWEFYLCYCEGSFRENYISTVQLIACKPKAKVPLFTGKL